jgi:hypothetical protein
MATIKTGDLYTHYHVDRADERRGLFQLLAEQYGCTTGLYPGCFVHVTPSFYLPSMIYADSDDNAARFFAGGYAQMIIAREKTYDAAQLVEFHHQDYGKPLPVNQESVDLLISQYAGPVSAACGKYLESGGVLVANNSHADAGIAGTDPSFELVAVVKKRGTAFSMSTEDLDAYLTPKSASVPTDREELRTYLMERGRGVRYAKSASHYIFRKR